MNGKEKRQSIFYIRIFFVVFQPRLRAITDVSAKFVHLQLQAGVALIAMNRSLPRRLYKQEVVQRFPCFLVSYVAASLVEICTS